LSLSQAFFGLGGAWRGNAAWMNVARPAVSGQFVFVATAFACLVYAFVNNDFSVMYVARNSNSNLPLFYRVAALWGAHEGSLLLWILILSIWSLAVAAFSRQLCEPGPRGHGPYQQRLHAVHALDLESVPAPDPRRPGRCGPQPRAAGF